MISKEIEACLVEELSKSIDQEILKNLFSIKNREKILSKTKLNIKQTIRKDRFDKILSKINN